jgi:hypothetical protein
MNACDLRIIRLSTMRGAKAQAGSSGAQARGRKDICRDADILAER